MFEDPMLMFFWLLCTWLAYNWYSNRRQELSQFQDELHARVNALVHRVKSEKHNNMVYWFDEDDDSFLAQGRNLVEIVKTLQTRFPDHLFFLHYNNKDHLLAGVTDWKIIQVRPEDLT